MLQTNLFSLRQMKTERKTKTITRMELHAEIDITKIEEDLGLSEETGFADGVSTRDANPTYKEKQSKMKTLSHPPRTFSAGLGEKKVTFRTNINCSKCKGKGRYTLFNVGSSFTL